MSNYGLQIDGINNDQMPCLLLSHIIDVQIVSGDALDYDSVSRRLKQLYQGPLEVSKFSCVKFRGNTYSDYNTGRFYSGLLGARNAGSTGKHFIPSPFWNFRVYCYEPVSNNKTGGVYGVEVRNARNETTFIATSGLAYAEDFRIGEFSNEERLYLSSAYALKDDITYFYATSSAGKLVRASMFNGNVEKTSYEVQVPIFSIAPPTQDDENELGARGRVFYVR